MIFNILTVFFYRQSSQKRKCHLTGKSQVAVNQPLISILTLFLKETTHFLSHETSTFSTKVIQSSSSNAVMDSGLFLKASMKICISRSLLMRSILSAVAVFLQLANYIKSNNSISGKS